MEKPISKIKTNFYNGNNSGYVGASMSKNALDAYKSGKKPLSKFNKQDLLYFNFRLEECEIDEKMATVKELKELLQRYNNGEWHHTSKYFNRTSFYDINYIFDTYEIGEIRVAILKIQNKYVGSELEKQNKKEELEEEKRREENLRRNEEIEKINSKISTEKMYKNSTLKAQEILKKYNIESTKVSENENGIVLSRLDGSVQVSESGNIYFNGTKPTSKDYGKGIENHFSVGVKRLTPVKNEHFYNAENGYKIQIWNGKEWENEEE